MNIYLVVICCFISSFIGGYVCLWMSTKPEHDYQSDIDQLKTRIKNIEYDLIINGDMHRLMNSKSFDNFVGKETYSKQHENIFNTILYYTNRIDKLCEYLGVEWQETPKKAGYVKINKKENNHE